MLLLKKMKEGKTMSFKNYPCYEFEHFIHGADYNPEQWIHDKTIWDEDMKLMKLAGTNEMTVGIFSWAKLEPEEGQYDFSFLDEIFDKIEENDGKIILATPSGARPHWLAERYPEVLRVGKDGVREHFRARHNHCFTSPIYREKVQKINRLLAERYGHRKSLIAWHISNEFSGECHCPYCIDAFRNFLKEKYHHDINELNYYYWNTFWSHTYTSFDQIEAPGTYTETGVHALNLDWHRFVTHQTMDFIKAEVEPLREITPHIPVTTNMMFEFYDLDYHKLKDVIDFASWDSYPEWHNGDDVVIANKTAFWHDLYRSLKKKPFLLMESTPSLVNWKPFNKPKRPGLDVLSSIQAIAHGSDSVQYFQWRKSRGSSEKFHGAVVGHDGSPYTRVFKSVQDTSAILNKIDEVAGTITDAEVALIFDWENMWALDDAQAYGLETKKYFETCYSYHDLLWKRGIDVDVVAPYEDLSKYKLVIAPMLYLCSEETILNLDHYVKNGGCLYGTYMMATVDEHDLCYLKGTPGSSLKDVFGIVVEEIDTLYPNERQHTLMNQKAFELIDYCEVIHTRNAEVLASYADGYYKWMPTVTFNQYHDGLAVYQAARDSGLLKNEIMDEILKRIPIKTNTALPLNYGTVAHRRGEYLFVENYNKDETSTTQLLKPMLNLLTNEVEETCILKPYSFAVFKDLELENSQ